MNMSKNLCLIAGVCLVLLGCRVEREQQAGGGAGTEKPSVTASSQIEAGRYLIMVSGCNDCHTDGFMQNNTIPENEWLTGSPVGWRGPWGTTYAQNLRLRIEDYTEDQWVTMAHTRNTLPPMAWFSLNNMSEKDLRAMYAYIKSMGPKGERMPTALPPGEEPETPYISLVPENLPDSLNRGSENERAGI